MPILLFLKGLITSGRSAMPSEMHVSISPAEFHWPMRYSKNLNVEICELD